MSRLNFGAFMAGENDGYEDVPVEVAEGAVIDADVAEASEEIIGDAAEFEAFDQQTDELVADADELGAAEEALGEQLEDPNFEGIDEFAAEMLGNRIAEIATRRGMDFGSFGSTFSKESFGSNINNRRQRTEIAHEGLGSAIKSMWEKIKAAIKAAIDYVKDFWKKHVSTIGRLIKALEKTGKRARDVKGSPDGSKDTKASTSLQKAVYGTGPITTDVIQTLIGRHDTAINDAVKSVNAMAGIVSSIGINELNALINQAKSDDADKLKGGKFFSDVNKEVFQTFGTKDSSLIDGWFGEISSEGNIGDSVTIQVKWDQRAGKTEKERSVVVGSKANLEKLCTDTIRLLKHTQQLGAAVEKSTTEFNKKMNDLSTVIGKLPEDTSAAGRKAVNIASRGLRDTVRAVPKVSTKLTSLNVRLGKVVVSYVNQSVSNYTTA